MSKLDDDLPDPPQVVEEAIQNQSSISDIADKYTGTSRTKNRLVVRVHRYLKRMPGGERLKKYLLNDGAWYRLNAAARLITTSLEGDEDPILDLMVEGGVPIVSLSRGAEDERNAYSYWYIKISRDRPKETDYVLELENKAPTLEIQNVDTSAKEGSNKYFDIQTYEFSP